jgi:hypothetical protein
MALTNNGMIELLKGAIAEALFTPINNTNAHLGVGDSSTAFSAAQTDLQAASNKTRKAMEATYPQRSSSQLIFRSLFGTSDANWAWNEHGVFNASTSGVMYSRKVESLGTKANTQSWQLTVTVTGAAA